MNYFVSSPSRRKASFISMIGMPSNFSSASRSLSPVTIASAAEPTAQASTLDIIRIAQSSRHGHRDRLGHLGDFAEAGEDGGCALAALIQTRAEFLALEHVRQFGQQFVREAKRGFACEQRIHQLRGRARPDRAGQQHIRVNDQFHARVVRLSLL